jgi:hypothetical protein
MEHVASLDASHTMKKDVDNAKSDWFYKMEYVCGKIA